MINFHDRGKISSIVVSSALGHSGSGIVPYKLNPYYRKLIQEILEREITVIAKSATRYPRKGNVSKYKPWTYWWYIKRLPGGTIINAYNLTNDGIEKIAKMIANAHRSGFQVIPSLYPEFATSKNAVRETIEALEICQATIPNFWAAEINFSCPNSEEVIGKNTEETANCIMEIRKNFPFLILIAKGSILHDWNFYRELKRFGVDVFHTINTIPFKIVYPDQESPLHNGILGAVSGGDIFQRSLRYNHGLRKILPNTPIIMGGGITRVREAQHFLNKVGADSASFCSLAVLDPKEAIRIIQECNR